MSNSMLKQTKFEISPNGAFGTSSSYFGIAFGAAQEPKNGKISLVDSVHTCREGLISRMRGRLTEGKSNQPTDKMRMMFKFSAGEGQSGNIKVIESWMERAIPALQALDRIAGWPLTRVYRVQTDYDNWCRAYYTHSSRRWMKSSYLVSLYCLMVRMCKDTRITGFKDFAGLEKKMKTILASGKNLASDHSYVKTSFPYWESLMRGYPRLFRQRKMDYYWDTGRLKGGGSSAGSEGIQRLVSGGTGYTEIHSELRVIKKELKAGTFSPTPKTKKGK